MKASRISRSSRTMTQLSTNRARQRWLSVPMLVLCLTAWAVAAVPAVSHVPKTLDELVKQLTSSGVASTSPTTATESRWILRLCEPVGKASYHLDGPVDPNIELPLVVNVTDSAFASQVVLYSAKPDAVLEMLKQMGGKEARNIHDHMIVITGSLSGTSPSGSPLAWQASQIVDLKSENLVQIESTVSRLSSDKTSGLLPPARTESIRVNELYGISKQSKSDLQEFTESVKSGALRRKSDLEVFAEEKPKAGPNDDLWRLFRERAAEIIEERKAAEDSKTGAAPNQANELTLSPLEFESTQTEKSDELQSMLKEAERIAKERESETNVDSTVTKKSPQDRLLDAARNRANESIPSTRRYDFGAAQGSTPQKKRVVPSNNSGRRSPSFNDSSAPRRPSTFGATVPIWNRDRSSTRS